MYFMQGGRIDYLTVIRLVAREGPKLRLLTKIIQN